VPSFIVDQSGRFACVLKCSKTLSNVLLTATPRRVTFGIEIVIWPMRSLTVSPGVVSSSYHSIRKAVEILSRWGCECLQCLQTTVESDGTTSNSCRQSPSLKSDMGKWTHNDLWAYPVKGAMLLKTIQRFSAPSLSVRPLRSVPVVINDA